MSSDQYQIRTDIFCLQVSCDARGIRKINLSQSVKSIRESKRLPEPVRQLKTLLGRYEKGEKVSFRNVKLDESGLNAFDKKILKELRKVKRGHLVSYESLGRAAGHQRAARAVGNVMRKNPWPIVIPCHRVIRTDGGLGGYSLGISLKKRLLEIEGVLK